jgi:hypothetical protein
MIAKQCKIYSNTIKKKYKEIVLNSQIGPSVSSNGGWSKICRNIGSKNANVLPLPVLAIPIMSRPKYLNNKKKIKIIHIIELFYSSYQTLLQGSSEFEWELVFHNPTF